MKPAHRGGSQAEQPASCPGQGSPRGQWGVAGHLRKGLVSGGSRNKASLHSSECRHLAAVFTRMLGLHTPDALRSQTEGADQVRRAFSTSAALRRAGAYARPGHLLRLPPVTGAGLLRARSAAFAFPAHLRSRSPDSGAPAPLQAKSRHVGTVPIPTFDEPSLIASYYSGMMITLGTLK